ncbi:type II toxin-antitoxin system HicB family antitoxin [Microbulbifer sp.]|uniref:type II toxin-antitoxin system HicB family antitoxin n=1 Tax=Microbulbifer sp. TaxID=1908541 RepID=UPI003F3E68DF
MSSNLMKYKGYYGSIEASEEDNCLFGKLEYIRPLVNYEGETVAELRQAFEEAVNDYLADCEKRGEEPEKPCKGSFNVRVGQQRHLRMAMYVGKGRPAKSINDLVVKAIDHELERLEA